MDSNVYAADGTTILLSQQNKYRVNSGGSFRGTTGLSELVTDNTTTYTSAAANGALAGTTVGPVNIKSYSNVVGTEALTYGLVTTTTIVGFSFAITSYFTPPTAWPLTPTLNTPYRTTSTVTTEATATSPASSSAQTVTTTFLGVEQVSVAAGTFAGCKYKTDSTAGATTTSSFSYIVATGRLKGHILKQENASGVRTLEAKVLLLNGS